MNNTAINNLIEFYKERYYDIQKQELYKWEALQHFQKTWDIEANNFPNMLEDSLSKIYNLGSASRYNAHKGILMAASKNGESVRQLFRDLYDENIDIKERIECFKDASNEILKTCDEYKDLNKQDVRAIVLYLTLRYPERYYLYKYDMFMNFADFIQYNSVPGDDIQRVMLYFDVCDQLHHIVTNDKELMALYQDRRKDYGDTECHMLVQDIIYALYYYQNPDKLESDKKKDAEEKQYIFSKPKDAKKGEFGSWQIMNDNLIVKETDNFFLKKYQAVLPEEAYWFFEIPKQIENNTFAIQVGYENHNYTVFFKQSETSAQIQMIWTSALSEVLEQYMLEKACYPYCAFKRTGEKQYEMMLMPGERKRFQEPLDDGHSDEEIEEHARTIDTESLTEIVRHRANLHPSSKDITIQQIVRDKYIAEYAKRRAKGVCQLCMQPAPFKKNDGEPYLESHHIIWLSRGGADSGENVVALCPNCHRKMHIVDDQGDIQKLKEIIEHIDK